MRFVVGVFSLLGLACVGCVRWTPPAITPAGTDSCRSSAVAWFAPDDTRERTRLDQWCEGVGAPEFNGGVGVDSASAASISDVVFVSWNVHVGSGDIRSFVADLRAGMHTRGRRFPHFVLLVQEAVRTGGVPAFSDAASGASRITSRDRAPSMDIVQISDDLRTSLIYVPSMRNGRADDPPEDRGNAILSTLPLSAPAAIELPGERQRRVVVTARVGTFSVGSVHLDTFGGARRLRIFWTPWLRDVQIRSLASVLPDGPLVLGADLNTWHGRDEPAARFLGAFFRATPLTTDTLGLGLRVLDYMFFRAPGRRAHYRQVEARYGSDHRPLVGWVEPLIGNP